MERFVHTLKMSSCVIGAIPEAQQNIFERIEVFYNQVRYHSPLGYGSPTELETTAGTLN